MYIRVVIIRCFTSKCKRGWVVQNHTVFTHSYNMNALYINHDRSSTSTYVFGITFCICTFVHSLMNKYLFHHLNGNRNILIYIFICTCLHRHMTKNARPLSGCSINVMIVLLQDNREHINVIHLRNKRQTFYNNKNSIALFIANWH